MTTRQSHTLIAATVLSLLTLLLGTPAVAATTRATGSWVQQAPIPTGMQLNAVEMLSATQAWAGGVAGAIVHTSDAGATWQVQTSPTPSEPIYAINFKDSLHGWASTNNGVLYTTDGGARWDMGTGPVGSLMSVGFADLRRGFVATGYPTLFKTTDGGVTWTSFDVPFAISNVQFFDSTHGVLSGPGGVLQTSNGGRTFTTVAKTHGGMFADMNHGWAVSYDRASFTTDGGRTWRASSVPNGQWIYGSTAPDATHGWAAGANGGIIHTTDGGATWTTQRPPTDVQLFKAIDFSDASHGMAVGTSGFLFGTTDGGATWQNLQSGSGTETYDLAVGDASHVWAAQTFGEILRTTDGGAHWLRSQVGATTSHLHGIDFSGLAVGWAVGDGEQSFNHGVIYGTRNGGRTWTKQYDGLARMNPLYDVAAISRTVAVAVGNLGDVLRTTDGLTWSAVAHPPASVLSGVDFVGAVGYIVGNGSTVLRSPDQGATWVSRSPHLSFGASLEDASFVNGSTGWVVGFDGIILRTDDGGKTWTDQGLGTSSGINVLGVDAIDATTAWISGYDNGRNFVARTIDAGATWIRETLPQTASASSVSDVEFLTADSGWAGGYSGIWKRT